MKKWKEKKVDRRWKTAYYKGKGMGVVHILFQKGFLY